MYETHFGLRQRPFRATPDTAHYYPASTHERALARMLRAIEDDEGFVLLTAEPGLGKTLACHVALERLGKDVASAFLTNSHVSDRLALLQAICYELSLPHDIGGEQATRLALTQLLLENYAAGRRTILIADEAQHLSAELLEELRMLGNLEASGGKALQVILAAQPEIADVMEQRSLACLRQRIATRVRLEPLGLEEASDYLRHQIRVAGGRPDELLAEEAVVLLARSTGGIPRLLNQAAHQAFLLARGAGSGQVDVEAALEALAALGLGTDDAAEPASMVNEDSGPVLTLAEPGLALAAEGQAGAFAGDSGDVDDYERMVPPKRPA